MNSPKLSNPFQITRIWYIRQERDSTNPLLHGTSMASICYYSLSLPPIPKPPNSHTTRPFSTCLSVSIPNPFLRSIHTFRSPVTRANDSPSSTTVQQQGDAQKPSEEDSMSIDNLHSFFKLNLGKWKGSFFVSLFSHLLLICF